MTVADLQTGQRGIIAEFDPGDLPTKLVEMGCLPGNPVQLLMIAPLKDPFYIDLNGTKVAIRRDLASQIPLHQPFSE